MNESTPAVPDDVDRKPLLIIVDDEPSILSALRSLLRRSPFAVQTFGDCQEALAFLSDQTPEIIISDMRMPQMDGLQFLLKASDVCPSSSRLLLSGYEDKQVIIEAIAEGVAQMYILKPWEDAEILGILQSALETREEFRKRNLESLIGSITHLPSPPRIQMKMKQLLKKTDRSIKEVATEVEDDPAIVARILRIANSVYFGARNPIAQVQEAITFIGLEYMESLILGMSMFDHFGGDADASTVAWIEDLWQHATSRALIGRAIATALPDYGHPQVAYTTCLLADIGFMVRMRTDPEQYRQLIRLAKELRSPLHLVEAKVFSVGHAEVGAALLRFWNFPADIVEAIAQQHSVHAGDPLTRIVQIADVIDARDFTLMHDPALNPMIKEWQARLFSSTPRQSHKP